MPGRSCPSFSPTRQSCGILCHHRYWSSPPRTVLCCQAITKICLGKSRGPPVTTESSLKPTPDSTYFMQNASPIATLEILGRSFCLEPRKLAWILHLCRFPRGHSQTWDPEARFWGPMPPLNMRCTFRAVDLCMWAISGNNSVHVDVQ